ncbi:hypothetical protein OHA72_42965 [Dactylosporangium sp. NBC_01737]|uniref:hypothetical protein n=1 Tax=Dactylosporangium sp. NBC_01737 TaxID=2975959 RepID=UPI002E119AC0|nr:hypothetical protein OHA72_42965 [Dactylosporangium sp. NBC_01737]
MSTSVGRLIELVAMVVRAPVRAPSSRRYPAMSGEPLSTAIGPIASTRSRVQSRT